MPFSCSLQAASAAFFLSVAPQLPPSVSPDSLDSAPDPSSPRWPEAERLSRLADINPPQRVQAAAPSGWCVCGGVKRLTQMFFFLLLL